MQHDCCTESARRASRGRRIEEDATGRLIFTPLPCEVRRGGKQLDLGEVRICAWAAPIDPNRAIRAIVHSVLILLISIKLPFIF